MSERSFRRENERRVAAAKRRESRRARKAAAAAAVVGAFALTAPAASSAANFVVNTTDAGVTTCDPNDTSAPCSLPDAVNDANATAEDDVITFDSSLSGSTIDINAAPDAGPLTVSSSYDLTITGLGASNLTVTAGGTTQVFNVQGEALSISGLTITNGTGVYGGAVYVDQDAYFDLDTSVVSDSTATGDFYSGPAFHSGAGGGIENEGHTTITNSLITGNHSTGTSGPFGGGGINNNGAMQISGSTISGNDSATYGGGIMNGITKYPTHLDISDSTISGNYAEESGGGLTGAGFVGSTKYGASQNTITDTTITNNDVNGEFGQGGGVDMKYIGGSDNWTISHSTIGDDNTAAEGGGLGLGYVSGHFTLIDSTISGNGATYAGGGAYLNGNAQKYPGAVQFQNSTIASNDAGYAGGGIFLDENLNGSPDSDKYPSYTAVGSTIVANNTAEGVDNDLDQDGGVEASATPGFGFDLSFSLVEAPGTADINELPPGSNIFGVDPQLGALTDNGGPTLTHLPATTSAVIDKGNAPSGLTTDQRGEARTVDTTPGNANDGTDIGSVELPSGTGPPSPPPAGSGSLGTKVHNIKKKHKKRRHVIRTFHNSAKIHLTFSSPVAGAVFTCSVDDGAFEPCKSPFSVRLKSAPGRGANHEITIVTKDQNGNQLGKPKTFKFRIIKKT
jgi:hypothetical protein